MLDHITEQLDALRASLRMLYKKVPAGAEQSKQALLLLEEVHRHIKNRIRGANFSSPADEIRYFRHLKPKLTSKMIYHLKVYHLELRASGASEEMIRYYLNRELEKMKAFYANNSEFIRYIQSEDTVLDKVYFMRDNLDFRHSSESLYTELDPEQTTFYDIKVAKLYAYEDLSAYMDNKLRAFDDPPHQPQRMIDDLDDADPAFEGWLQSDEIERKFKIGTSTLYKWRKHEGMPYHKIGGIYFYEENEVKKWMKNRGR
jgi:hypothetical protein